MKLSNFNYELPKDLLAEYPSDQRDESKLMVLDRKNQKIEHKTFKDLIDYFNDGDVFVLNNTKVQKSLKYLSRFKKFFSEVSLNKSINLNELFLYNSKFNLKLIFLDQILELVV